MEDELNKVVYELDTGSTKWRTSRWDQTSGITVTVPGQQHSKSAKRCSDEREGWWALERMTLHIFLRPFLFRWIIFLIYLDCNHSSKDMCQDIFSPSCVQKICSGKGRVACCKFWVLQTLRQSPSNPSFSLFLPSSWDTIFSPGFFHLPFLIYTLSFYLFLQTF